MTEDDVVVIKNLIKECSESYYTKADSVSDKEWLKNVLLQKIKGITEEKALTEAETIVKTITNISQNLHTLHQVEKQGVSKESWLANEILQDVKRDSSIVKGEDLDLIDNALYLQNMNIAGQPITEFTEDNDTEIIEEPVKEYSPYQMEDVAMDIGKNASAYGIQSAASMAGTMLAMKIMDGERIEPNKIIQEALKSGIDSSMQIVTSGALKIASENQLLQCLPKSTPAEMIASISSVGIEGVKIMTHIMSGEITFSKGLEQYGKLGISVVKNLWNIAKNTSVKEVLTRCFPFLGSKLTVIADVVGMVSAYMGGTDFGKSIVEIKTKVTNVAKAVAKTAVQGLRKAKEIVSNGLKKTKKILSKIFS